MAGNPLKVRRLYNLTPEVVRLQDSMADAVDYIAKIPMLQGVAITDVALTGGATDLINHGLGRDVQGYIITKIDTQATINDGIDNTAYDIATALPLYASVACTVDLWVW